MFLYRSLFLQAIKLSVEQIQWKRQYYCITLFKCTNVKRHREFTIISRVWDTCRVYLSPGPFRYLWHFWSVATELRQQPSFSNPVL